MAAEQAGAAKKKEGLTWLARYARSSAWPAAPVPRTSNFGEAFAMRPRLAPAVPASRKQRAALQKIAFEVAVGINRAAPVTANALVALTLLGVRDQALTLAQVRQVLEPILGYISVRHIPATGLTVLHDAVGRRRAVLSQPAPGRRHQHLP